MRDRILDLLTTKGDLPPLPEVVMRLRILLRDPDVNVSDVASLIELEPVLAGRILNMSNSAFYSRSTKVITSLPLAITKLGFNLLSRIVFTLKLVSLFNDNGGMSAREFWRHSLAVAIFTQALSRRAQASREEQDISYLAGLMHDVGIMVFAHLIPEDYSAFIKNVESVEKTLEVQEYELFGIDHAEVGALFIDSWWHIEEQVVTAVRNHHVPFEIFDVERRCSQLVNIANGICNNQGITNGIDCHHDLFNDTAWDELGFSLTDAEDIIADVKTALAEAELFLIRG